MKTKNKKLTWVKRSVKKTWGSRKNKYGQGTWKKCLNSPNEPVRVSNNMHEWGAPVEKYAYGVGRKNVEGGQRKNIEGEGSTKFSISPQDLK